MNALIQTGYVIGTTYVNGVAVCDISSDMSPGLTYTGFFQYLQPGILCNIPNNTKVALSFSPHKHVGGVTGAVNIIPDGNTTLTGGNELKSGEVALVNIDNFNYSIQAKVDSLVAIFKNDNGTITTKPLISENIVLILLDIIKEFNKTVADAINNHVHNAGGTLVWQGGLASGDIWGYTGIPVQNPPTPIPPVDPIPIPPTPANQPYTPSTPLVKNDNDYLSNAECYVNNDGKGTIPK